MAAIRFTTVTILALLLLSCGSDSIEDSSNIGGINCPLNFYGGLRGDVTFSSNDPWGTAGWTPTAVTLVPLMDDETLIAFNNINEESSTNVDIAELSLRLSATCSVKSFKLFYYNTGDVPGLNDSDNRYLYQLECAAGDCSSVVFSLSTGIIFNDLVLPPASQTNGIRNDASNPVTIGSGLLW